MDIVTIVFFILGLVVMIIGAEMLVRGASHLAATAGISPLVIGLTVVAYGTSSPELAVSFQSTLSNQSDLMLGNVIGSNIINVLLILGLSASIAPLIVSQQLIRLDVPLMIGVSVLLLLLCLDGAITRLDGAILFTGAVVYTIFVIRQSRRESAAVKEEYAQEYSAPKEKQPWLVHMGLIVGGLALLTLGSSWLVDSAVAFATFFGVSEIVIGLTVVAVGTSLPEVATSVIASVRGERDIAVGNVIGSNLSNILLVLGFTGLITPENIPVPLSILTFDLPVMIAVAVACLPIFFSGHVISRWEGALFFAYYVVYTVYVVLDAIDHALLPPFSTLLSNVLLPITAFALAVITLRAMIQQRRSTAR